MEFFDTHCHIQSAGLANGERQTSQLWARAPDLSADTIIDRARAAGVKQLICVGCDLADSRLAIDFASQHDNVWPAIGIHPHEASCHQTATQKTRFASLLEARPLAGEGKASSESSGIVAIGECGLDYFYNHSPKPAQFDILRFQIKLAQQHDLPMIFHVREAFDDFWPIYDEMTKKGGKIRGVLHSFTDNQVNLRRAIDNDLYIGVNGIATFAKQADQLAMYKSIPLQKLLLETDAPFLTPVPFRGTVNEPKHVRTTAEFLSHLRGESLDKIANTSTANARELFSI